MKRSNLTSIIILLSIFLVIAYFYLDMTEGFSPKNLHCGAGVSTPCPNGTTCHNYSNGSFCSTSVTSSKKPCSNTSGCKPNEKCFPQNGQISNNQGRCYITPDPYYTIY
jgi:hypothetical protein